VDGGWKSLEVTDKSISFDLTEGGGELLRIER